MRRFIWLSPLLLCLSACGGDDLGGLETSMSGISGTGGDGDGDNSDEGEAFVPVPARGVTLTRVTANHGINVSIAQDGAWVGPDGREGRLASGRDTLIRVYYQLDENWVERDIEARLELTVDGEVHEFSAQKTVVVDSSDQYLDGSMWFALPATEGLTEPGASFHVSLWEVEPGGEELAEHVAAAPETGSELIGFEDIPMAMNVVFVPFTWNGRTPDFGNADKMKLIENEIYQTEPIQVLNTQMDDLRSNGASADVCNMLSTMQQIWSQAGAPANVYYVGLVDTGASSGVMGCALINANFNADVWVDSSMGITATSIVHEIGHNQGLNHVECDDMGNPSAGNDPNYPDAPHGRTLNTGFGIRDFSMYPGDTTTDYMSYCTKRWVSPWTWNKVWPRIQSFTEMGSPLVVDPEPVMQFGMYADGSTEWWTALARFDAERPPSPGRVEFIDDGEVVAREPVWIDTLSDDQSMWVRARMPGGDHEFEFDSVRYVSAEDEAVHEARHDEVSFYTDLDFGLEPQ
jgi:hypothetical protein